MIKIIAAVSSNRVIGKNGDLVITDKDDMAHFKKLTKGNVVIMGRKTWESLGSKPLQDRINVIISDKKIISGQTDKSIYFTIFNIEEIKMIAKEHPDKTIYIIGGGSIYEQTIDLADELIITEFNTKAEGDTVFPEIDSDIWYCKYQLSYPKFVIKTYRKNGYN